MQSFSPTLIKKFILFTSCSSFLLISVVRMLYCIMHLLITTFLHLLLFLVQILVVNCVTFPWNSFSTCLALSEHLLRLCFHKCRNFSAKEGMTLPAKKTLWFLTGLTALNRFLPFIHSFLGRSSRSAVPPVHFHRRLRMLLVVPSADFCCDRAVLETSQERPSNSVTQLMCCNYRVLYFNHSRWLRPRVRGNLKILYLKIAYCSIEIPSKMKMYQ